MKSHFPLQRDDVFQRVFRAYNGPNFSVRLWDGWEWCLRPALPAACSIVVHSPASLHRLVAEPNEITLGEAFVHGELTVEGDLFSVFDVAEYLFEQPRPLGNEILRALADFAHEIGQTLRHGLKYSRARDKASISFHYDQPVEFYRPWLGETLAYSCAYFRSPDEPLELAQTQKLDLICRKLRLKPGEKFLDIGCGWGSLVLHAARCFGARAHGITLSERQYRTAQDRIAAAHLEDRCRVELRDYRDCASLAGSFDKIASVGMYEHVGLPKLSDYFRIVHSLLKPGGTFLNHGIARSSSAPVWKYSFIERYVFPDGRLVTLPQAIQCSEDAGLEVRDAENLREHYEITLRHWVARLQQHADEVMSHVSVATYRTWLLYMAGSAAAFCRGALAVYQLLLSRPKHGRSELPLAREDWYNTPLRGEEIDAPAIQVAH